MRRSHNAIMNLTARINPATPNPSAVCRCLTRCGQICPKARGRPRPQKERCSQMYCITVSTDPPLANPKDLRPVPVTTTRCGQDGRAPNLAKRRAGVHARRNNTALNTSTSPFSRIRHPCTPEKPQASSSHRQSLRPGWPRAKSALAQINLRRPIEGATVCAPCL